MSSQASSTNAFVDVDEAWRAGPGRSPGMDERVFRDSRGIEWEVFDESDALSVALEFDHVPPQSNPGLLFVSTLGRRRLWPCPSGWQFLGDVELEGLCSRAATLM